MDTMSENKYLPLAEAAQIKGVSQDYLRLLIFRKNLRGVKLGRNWFTTIEWLNEYFGVPKLPSTAGIPAEGLERNGIVTSDDRHSGADDSGTIKQVVEAPAGNNIVIQIPKSTLGTFIFSCSLLFIVSVYASRSSFVEFPSVKLPEITPVSFSEVDEVLSSKALDMHFEIQKQVVRATTPRP